MSCPLIVANWKMHKQAADGSLLVWQITKQAVSLSCDIVLCPPVTLLHLVSPLLSGSPLALGGQDCHFASQGPHTGDIAASMLVDAGASYVILGHSERRAEHGESNAVVRAKTSAALASGLIPVICVGETAEERQADHAEQVVSDQLRQSLPLDPVPTSIVIAYEPLWAIGSGQVPDAADIERMHAVIKRVLDEISRPKRANSAQGHTGPEQDDSQDDSGHQREGRVLYGGSVKPDNASEILAIDGVDGLLVGGASLQLDSFWPIIMAGHQHGSSESVSDCHDVS